MSLDGALDLMAPVQTSGGKTVWIKVGMYFPNVRGHDARGNAYAGTVSLLTLPIGATAPLELYAYPTKDSRRESGDTRGKKTRGAAPSSKDASGGDYDPEGDAGDYEMDPFDPPG